MYGFTGALNAQMPCLEICSSTTGYGRKMIESTKCGVLRSVPCCFTQSGPDVA